MLWPAGELERGGVFGIGRRAQLCCILLEVIMRWHWIFLPVLLVSLGLWVLLWLAWLQGRSGVERGGSMRTLGIMILLGIACFWAGRLTGKPEIVRMEERVYSPPVDFGVFCRTLYPVPEKECPRQ